MMDAPPPESIGRTHGRRRKYLSAVVVVPILLVLSCEIMASLHFVGEDTVDADYAVPAARKPTTYPPTVELCGGCRIDRSSGGRRLVTCLDRITFLRNRYNVTAEQARADVLKKSAEHCAMTRFPVELWSPSDEDAMPGFDSMFAGTNETRDDNAAPAVRAAADDLRIYFYETIPDEMGLDVERDMSASYARENFSQQNFKTDLAVINLFRTHPGRTTDPDEADLFVVPFPHASHCLRASGISGVWKTSCGHVSAGTIRQGVLDRLAHFRGNEKRHLFINGHEIFHSHQLLQNVPLSLTLGPRLSLGGHHIVIPYLNDQRPFQPSAIRKRSKAWYGRPRSYSLCYFFGSENRRMRGAGPRKYRMFFLEEVQRNWNETARLGGLPYVIQSTGEMNDTSPRFFGEMYSESVFCPVLPGDSPSQKRFFDVIMSGCIPVVLSFDTPYLSGKSWYQPGGHPIEECYPWAKGSNSSHDEIDYRDFVVEVPDGVENIKPTIEALMKNASEIRRRQLIVMKYAPYFAFGMGSDSHRYPDAFSKILEMLRFYLDGL